MRSVITGQHVSTEKKQRAREMREAMTPAEAALWEHIRLDKLGVHFRRQQIIDGFIVDFYCHSAKLVIEVDGLIHERQQEYDAQRDEIIKRRGLTMLRVRNEEVENDVEEVLSRIRACLPKVSQGVSKS
jgi:very-short-patch-repair endonuclease